MRSLFITTTIISFGPLHVWMTWPYDSKLKNFWWVDTISIFCCFIMWTRDSVALSNVVLRDWVLEIILVRFLTELCFFSSFFEMVTTYYLSVCEWMFSCFWFSHWYSRQLILFTLYKFLFWMIICPTIPSYRACLYEKFIYIAS